MQSKQETTKPAYNYVIRRFCLQWIVLTKKMHRFSCSFYDIFTLDLLYCYSYNLSNINFAFLMAVIQSHLSISGGLNFNASYLLRCGSLKSTVVLRLSKHKTTPTRSTSPITCSNRVGPFKADSTLVHMRYFRGKAGVCDDGVQLDI